MADALAGALRMLILSSLVVSLATFSAHLAAMACTVSLLGIPLLQAQVQHPGSGRLLCAFAHLAICVRA